MAVGKNNLYEVESETGNYRSGFVRNLTYDQDVKIHFIEKFSPANEQIPLVYSPGLWEPAERAIPLFEGLDCRCASLSYRGRGKSDTPERGYDLKHHVADLHAVVNALGFEKFCLLGFSRGAGVACGYVQAHPENVTGLVLVDQPPLHVGPQPGYADYWKNLVYLGRPISQFMRAEALDGLEREAREVWFWDVLSGLTIPVLVLRGVSRRSKIPSSLTDEDMENYRSHVKNLQTIDFEFSGHMIVDEEVGKFRAVVYDFIKSLSIG